MPLQTSRLHAPPAERPVVAPPWLIALLAGLVGGGLLLMYPRQDLERRLAASTAGTDIALSVVYLRNLLRSDPGNAELRLLLVRQHMRLGEYPEARAALLAPLVSEDERVLRERAWLEWELDYAEYIAIPPDEEELRAQRREPLRQSLRALSRNVWSDERREQLNAWAAQLREPEPVANAPEPALDPNDPNALARQYEQAAREALGVSDYQRSADLYILARKATPDPQRAKAYFLAALDVLQSGNRPADALALGEREIGPLADDPQVLLRMTRLARSAARPDVADRYIRKLLRMSLALPGASTMLARAAAFDDGAQWLSLPQWASQTAHGWGLVPTAQPAKPPTPALPFDDTVYTLAYEVFLENSKQDDAWAIARSAVQQRPQDVAWRERLAKVSEWTGRPIVALENWLVVAQRTQRDDAWQAVLRIAPGQFDDAALVQALRYQLRGNASDMRLVRELVGAYERLGEPQPAIDYLEANVRNAEGRELLAQLAERAGQPELALKHWRSLLAEPGMLTPARAMQAAVLALLLRQPQVGLPWLEAARHGEVAPDQAQDFWRMTGHLAEGRQRLALAVEAYRKLITLPEAETSDYEALIRLIQDEHPLEAARLNELAWERYHRPDYLVNALTFHVSRSRWSDAAALINQVNKPSAPQRKAAADLAVTPEYLRLAGTYYQNIGDTGRARASLLAGLRAAPESTDMRSALLWLFIDGNDAVSLRTLLTTHEPVWSRDEGLHDSLAAAWQALSLPQTALDRYLRPRVSAKAGNFLWLMNYADALDQNQQFDQAWRLRRQLLLDQRKRAPAREWLTEEGLDTTRRVARARLVLSQRPGDPAMDVLRELLRLDRDAEGKLSNAAAETAIGWLQDAGQYSAERAFLWHQYARSQGLRSNRPLWADITLALAEKDKASTGQLLESFDERLPRYDRVNAARAVDDLRLAQTAAFEGMGHQYDDETLHLQLTESLLAFSDHAGAKARVQRLSGMDEKSLEEKVHLALTPRLSLDLSHGRTLRQATRADAVTSPPHETAAQARLRWRHPDGETQLSVAEHRSFATFHPVEIEHMQRIDERLQLRMSLGISLPTQDSLALRIAGMKDRVSASVRYQATRQDAITITLWGERYQLQTGGALGSGRHAMVYYTHTYRQDAPLLEFGAFASYHGYRRADLSLLSARDEGYRRYLPPLADGPGIDYFLPDSFRFYGLQVSTNMRFEEEYSRKLRPYAIASRTWHSRFGPGYGLRLGVATSVVGPDHLRFSWGYEKSGLKSDGPSRDLEISYRLHF
ncbi:tetratricopeptide repeat protein [Paracidovorax sp. MALMAid1276]|uniref:tetratricopeptide repeat protein n=1 Tax=Paracidovorax sp. MALMAid1276 TaxID=3411631 RepID=UPI003B99CA06